MIRHAAILIALVASIAAMAQETRTWSYEFNGEEVTSKTYTEPFVLTSDDGSLTWTLDAYWQMGNPYITASGSDYLQVGSSSNPILWAKLCTDGISGSISEVSVEMSGSKTATLTVSVGGTELGSIGMPSTDMKTYTFRPEDGEDASGRLEIYASFKGSYYFIQFKSVSVTYTVQDTDDAAVITVGSSGYATYSSDRGLNFSRVTDSDGNPAELSAHVATCYYPGNTVGIMRVDKRERNDAIVAPYTGIVVRGAEGTYRVEYTDDMGAYMSNLLVASVTPTYVATTDGDYTNYILTGDGFYISSGGTLAANKAYLRIPTSYVDASGSNMMRIVEVDDEDTDGITDTGSGTDPGQGAWYTLQGVRVAAPRQGGIYLRGGHKVVVR